MGTPHLPDHLYHALRQQGLSISRAHTVAQAVADQLADDQADEAGTGTPPARPAFVPYRCTIWGTLLAVLGGLLGAVLLAESRPPEIWWNTCIGMGILGGLTLVPVAFAMGVGLDKMRLKAYLLRTQQFRYHFLQQ